MSQIEIYIKSYKATSKHPLEILTRKQINKTKKKNKTNIQKFVYIYIYIYIYICKSKQHKQNNYEFTTYIYI